MVTPQHIGIVGCSAEGAALCYRTICVEGQQLFGPYAHPEVSIHTHSLASYLRCIDADNWAGVGELMLSSAHKLAQTGADFLICADNTIHRALPSVHARLPLPWIHIADVVADEAIRRRFQRLGLLGTRWLVESSVYTDVLAARGLECVRPPDHDRVAISRIIMEQLVNGLVTADALTCFQRVAERLQAESCDAVILGCTELPLLANDTNSPLPVLDSTRLLARAALRRAVGAAHGG